MNRPRCLASGAALGLALQVLAVQAHALDLAGNAWVFSGSQDYEKKNRKVDSRHEMKGRKKRPLKGSSCCETLVVGFPTNETFWLRHGSYQIATGDVRTKGRNLVLRVAEASRGALLWWLENELEAFWNAGVFDLDLNLRLEKLSSHSIKVKVRSVRGDQEGILKLNLRFRGEVRGFDHTRVRRLATGPVRGKARIKGKRDRVISLQGIEEGAPGLPLPPILSCEEKKRRHDDYYGYGYYYLGKSDPVTAASWRGPDYCRE